MDSYSRPSLNSVARIEEAMSQSNLGRRGWIWVTGSRPSREAKAGAQSMGLKQWVWQNTVYCPVFHGFLAALLLQPRLNGRAFAHQLFIKSVTQKRTHVSI